MANRKLITSQESDLDFCCGVNVVGEFDEYDEFPADHDVNCNCEDCRRIRKEGFEGYIDNLDSMAGIVVFTAAQYQSRYRVGPCGFARWLREQRQTVTETPWVLNKVTGNKIRLYTWIPTAAFRKKFRT